MADKKENTESAGNLDFETANVTGDLYKLYAYARQGNKSAEMALRNRFMDEDPEADMDDFIDDEDLYKSSVSEDLQEIDKQLGKMLNMFLAKDKREQTKENELKKAGLSRKLLGRTDSASGGLFGGGGFAPALAGGGSFGSDDWDDKKNKLQDDDKVPGWLKELGSTLASAVGYDVGKLGLKQILKRIPGGRILYDRMFGRGLPKGKPWASDPLAHGYKGRLLTKEQVEFLRRTSARGIARDVAGQAGKVASVAGMAFGLNQMVSAEAARRREGEALAQGLDTSTFEGMLANYGLRNGVLSEETLATERGRGVGSLVGGGAALAINFIPGVGPILGALLGGALTAGGAAIGEMLAGGKVEELLKKAGLTQEDVDLAMEVAKGVPLETILSRGEYLSWTDEQRKALVARMQKALNVFILGIGDPDLPETWPVDTSIPDGTSTDTAHLATLPASFRSALNKVAAKRYAEIIKSITEEDSTYASLPNDKKPAYMAQAVKKLRAKYGFGASGFDYGSEVESLVGYDRYGLPSDKNGNRSPYAMGLAIDIQRLYSGVDDALKELGIRHIKGDPLPNRYFDTKSPLFALLVKNGLWTESPNGISGYVPGKKVVQTIAAGVQPEFLARGGMLDGPTSLGFADAENVHSLEETRTEISRVIQEGLADGGSDTLLDDMLIDVFSNTLLPSLSEILSNEAPLERGMSTPVSVFA